MREVKQFKIRCSAIGQIMTNARSKKEALSKTAQTYCINWLKEQIFARRKTINSKYLTKGNECEAESIDFAGKMTGRELFKNEAFFFDEHITGTPDIRIGDSLIIDLKNSWDPFTFPLFDTVVDKGYWWQLQGYMAITGCKAAQLIYVLSDAPEHLIEGEARREMYANGEKEMSLELYDKHYKNMTYSDIPDEDKIKIFEIERDEEAIKSIYLRVDECREYINSLCQ